MKSNSEDVSSEYFKDISKMISQEDKKSRQKMQKEFNKVIKDKEEEISHLRDHNQKLLFQIKKVKDRAQDHQNIEEENRDLQKKRLELKDDAKKQEETIKDLKNAKHLVRNKLVHIQKRTSKLLGSKKQVEENKANTNPVINIDKKEVSPTNEQTIKTPYRHHNYKSNFDQ